MSAMNTLAPMGSVFLEPRAYLRLAFAILLFAVPANAQQPGGEVSWNNPPEEPIPGVTHRTFKSDVIGQTIGYSVLVPPGYDDGDDQYPVLYWLHGAGGNETREARRIGPRIRRMMEERRVAEMVVVFPNGGPWSMYVDAADGSQPVETMIVDELLPEVERRFRVRPDRQSRGLEGMSMGGFGVLRLALKYPDRFSSVVAYAPALLDLVQEPGGGTALVVPGTTTSARPLAIERRRENLFQRVFDGSVQAWSDRSPWELVRRNAARIRGRLGIRVVIGSEDGTEPAYRRAQGNPEGLVPAARLFHELLEEQDVDHQFEVVEGVGHDPGPLYDRVGLEGLRFHANHGGW